jgi:putative ABC transport system ATP-binding protein
MHITRMAPASLIDLAHVSLAYESAAGRVDALKDVNLQVGEGETVGLIGPSGSGKSSLLMVVAGLERPSSGVVSILGRDITKMGEDDLARLRGGGIGIVFQNFHLIPTMTAAENVALPLEFARIAGSREAALAMLRAVGLGERATHYPGQLSGGEQQRVALARALVAKPRLLLADEPTGNLDQETGASVIRLIFDMVAAHGTGLLLITHDLTLAARCERQVTMRDGQLSQ